MSLAPTVQVVGRDVPITFESPVLEESMENLKRMKAFVDWCSSIDDGFTVNSIHVQSMDMSHTRVDVVKFKPAVIGRDGEAVDSVVVLRGSCVGVFVLITCEDDGSQYTLLSVQPRPSVGKYSSVELPTGELDATGSFVGLAAKEIKQEIGLEIDQKDLYDLTEKTCGPIFTSPGESSDQCRLFLYRMKMGKAQVDTIMGKFTGVLEDGEKIKLKLIGVHDIWRACPDMRALAAFTMYVNLVARRDLRADGEPAVSAKVGARNGSERVCSFLADLEGNLDLLVEFAKLSKVVFLEKHDSGQLVNGVKQRLEFRRKASNTQFCFGGDSQDKGVGDIRIARMLLDFKDRYPSRVHLIIGNRDCIKLRLTAELSDDAIADQQVATDGWFPYWVPQDKRVTPAEALAKDGATEPPNPKADRLKWMLKHTMGSDGAYERRRLELEEIRGVDVSDDDVVQSYINEVNPHAPKEERFLLQYLKRASLGYMYGKTLFVHGGLSDENFGVVPDDPAVYSRMTDWVVALNRWKNSQVAAFEQDPFSGKNTTSRRGHGLMDYGLIVGNSDPPFETASKGRTVICTTHLTNGNAMALSNAVAHKMAENGCYNLVVGHVPHGDCPTTIRTQKAIVVLGDTSFSEMGHKTRKEIRGKPCEWVDNRGGAVSEILVWEDGRIEVHGRRKGLEAGAAENVYDYALRYADGDAFVGRKVREGDLKDYWVKARYSDGKYCMCCGQGFKLDYQTRTREQLEGLIWDERTLPQDPPRPP